MTQLSFRPVGQNSHDIALLFDMRQKTFAANQRHATSKDNSDSFAAYLADKKRNNPDSKFYEEFAALDGNVIGYWMGQDFSLFANEGFVHFIYIDAMHRGCGYGAAMCNHIARTMAKVGLQAMNLQSFSGNNANTKFYESQGWRNTGQKDGFIKWKKDLKL